MRTLFAVALTLSTILAAAAPAVAKRKPRSSVTQTYGYEAGPRANEMERNRATSFPDYPDWAQRAFAPKGH